MFFIVGIVIILYALTSSYEGTAALSPMILPFICGVALTIFGAINLKNSLKSKKLSLKKEELIRPLLVLACLIGFVFLLPYLRFLIAGVLLCPLLAYMFGSRGRSSVIFGVALPIFVVIIFQFILGVRLI